MIELLAIFFVLLFVFGPIFAIIGGFVLAQHDWQAKQAMIDLNRKVK